MYCSWLWADCAFAAGSRALCWLSLLPAAGTSLGSTLWEALQTSLIVLVLPTDLIFLFHSVQMSQLPQVQTYLRRDL